MDNEQRLELINTLYALPPEQLDQIIYALNPPHGLIPLSSASQGQKAAKLLEWVESPTGCQLPQLQQVFQQLLDFAPPLPSENIPQNLPHLGTKTFVGRSQALGQIERERVSPHPQRSGVGKESAAIEGFDTPKIAN